MAWAGTPLWITLMIGSLLFYYTTNHRQNIDKRRFLLWQE